MKIFISDGNRRFIIEANENDSIKTLKEKIELQTGANGIIELLFRGKILKDYEKISKYSIKESSEILMIKKKEIYCAGGEDLKILIGFSSNIIKQIKTNSSCSVLDLKKQIKNQEGLKGNIELIFNGIILEDSQLLYDADIRDGYIINIEGEFRAGCYEFKKIRLN